MFQENEIGKNIRRIRKRKKLTLVDLANGTGFTKGYLSRVENSDKAPPVSTLLRIAKFFKVSMSALFGETPEPQSCSLVKKSERREMARNGSQYGYSFETLAHNFPDKTMAPYILTIPANIEESPFFEHPGEEMMFVLKGLFKLVHDGIEYLLEEGDCLYFDASKPHQGIALGGSEVKVLIVILTI